MAEVDEILEAITGGEVNKLEELLKDGAAAKKKNEKGQTYLHLAVEKNASENVLKSLLNHCDVGERNEDGETIVDLIANSHSRSEIVRNFVEDILVSGDVEKLEMMALGGWEVPRPTSAKRREIKAKSEEMDNLLDKLSNFEEQVGKIHTAVKEGDMRMVELLLERRKLVLAKDVTGLTPLHRAVVYGHTNIVKHISENYPESLNVQDNLGRTPLHYAGSSEDGALHNLLLIAGAKEDIADVHGKFPGHYLNKPENLDLKEFQQKLAEIEKRPRKKLRSRPSSVRVYSGKRSPDSRKESRPATQGTEASKAATTTGESLKSKSLSGYSEKKDPYLTTPSGDTPTTQESSYLAGQLGAALTDALADVVNRRPADPIEYMANWLYAYAANRDREKNERARIEKLVREREEYERQQLDNEVCKAEIKSQKAEDKRLEEEKAERERLEQERAEGKLPPVTEEGEEEGDAPPVDVQDDNGNTELHRAVQSGGDVKSVLAKGFSVSLKNTSGKTVRDLAVENGNQEAIEAIDAHVCSLFEKGDLDAIHAMVLSGYQHIPNLTEKYGENGDGLNEDAFAFYQSIPDIQEKLKKAREAIEKGDLRGVQGIIDRKALALGCNEAGISMLHLAILCKSEEIADYISESFPSSLQCRDNNGRTPLHYANAIDQKLVDVLIKAGANAEATDLTQHIPGYYSDHQEEILALVSSTGQSQEQLKDETSQLEEKSKDETEAPKDDGGEDKEEKIKEAGADKRIVEKLQSRHPNLSELFAGYGALYEKMDRNNDGVMSMSEFRSTLGKEERGDLEDIFEESDLDGDGELSKEEFILHTIRKSKERKFKRMCEDNDEDVPGAPVNVIPTEQIKEFLEKVGFNKDDEEFNNIMAKHEKEGKVEFHQFIEEALNELFS